MAEITVLQLMDMIEKDESIRNYQSRWRALRALLEKQSEVAAQQITQLDKHLVVRFTEQKEAYKIKTPS